MGRPRKALRKNWPTGLYARRDKYGQTFYVYREKAGAKEVYLGRDLTAAKQGVAIARSRVEKPLVQRVLSAIEKPHATLSEHITWYNEHVLDAARDKRGRSLSQATLGEAKRMLRRFQETMGEHRDIASFDRRTLSGFLENFPSRASNQYRTRLRHLFKHAVARGFIDTNPVEGTIERAEVIQRQRLPKDLFDAIREQAEPWFQRTLDLALYSLQRREDLTLLQADHWKDGRLHVAQKKVERHSAGRLRIAPGPKLLGAILACLNSSERDDCPFLIHRVPLKERKRKDRVHLMQLAPEQLSREFARLRDDLEAMKAIPAPTRPSFHEIRALGASLYEQEGWPKDRIQALMGHTEATTTELYLDGHGERWQEVVG